MMTPFIKSKRLQETEADNQIHNLGECGYRYLHATASRMRTEAIYLQVPDGLPGAGLWRILRNYKLKSGWTKLHQVSGSIDQIILW